jgi:hypothetical protein
VAVKKTKVSIPIIGGVLKIITTYYSEKRINSELFLHFTYKFSKLNLGANDVDTVKVVFMKILNSKFDNNPCIYNGIYYSHLINLHETYTSMFYSVEHNIVNILIVFNSNDPTRKQYFDDRYIKTIKMNSIDVLAKKIELL